MKTITRWITFLAVCSLLLAACTTPATPPPPAATQAPPVATQAPAASKTTIHVLTMEQAGPTVEEMNAIVAEFNKSNPEIEVLIDYVAYDALHDKIVTALASTPPAYDVFLVDDIWYAEFASKGYSLDVSARITDEMKSGVFDAAWQIPTVDGKAYGLPWLLDQKYFFYNEKLLKDAGFDAPPATWEEMVDQAKVIKDKKVAEYPIVWSWGQYEAAICDWVTLLYGNGGMMADKDGKPAFNSPAGVKTLEWMVKTIDDGVSNPSSISYVEEDVRNVFSQGKAVFAVNWNYMFDLVNFQKDQSQVTGQIKPALMPAFKDSGVKSATIDGSMGFSVAATSANPEAAWKYVVYLTSKDVQDRYSAHMLPMWKTSFEGDAGKKLEATSPVTAIMVPIFNLQFPYSVVRPKVSFYPETSKALQLALQEALTKVKTPQQALDDAAAKWLELMK